MPRLIGNGSNSNEIRPGYRKTDRFLLSVIAVYAVLACLYHARIKGWRTLVAGCVAVVVLYAGLEALRRRSASPAGRCFLRLASVSAPLLFIYEASVRMTLLFVPVWRDRAVVKLETAVLGVQPAVWLERFFSPPLTEWLMFSYLFYFFLYPIAGAVLYFKRGEAWMEYLLWALAVNNVACNLGYFLYPLADPVTRFGAGHFAPLKGTIFAPAGEFVRAHMMTIGGGMPSGHAAASVIMALLAYRYYRPLFYFLLPMAVSICVSTVYCRFHYLSGMLMGVGMAFLCWGALILAGKRDVGVPRPPA